MNVLMRMNEAVQRGEVSVVSKQFMFNEGVWTASVCASVPFRSLVTAEGKAQRKKDALSIAFESILSTLSSSCESKVNDVPTFSMREWKLVVDSKESLETIGDRGIVAVDVEWPLHGSHLRPSCFQVAFFPEKVVYVVKPSSVKWLASYISQRRRYVCILHNAIDPLQSPDIQALKVYGITVDKAYSLSRSGKNVHPNHGLAVLAKVHLNFDIDKEMQLNVPSRNILWNKLPRKGTAFLRTILYAATDAIVTAELSHRLIDFN